DCRFRTKSEICNLQSQIRKRFRQLLRLTGVSQRDFSVDHAGPHQLLDFAIEVLHSIGGAIFHDFQKGWASRAVAFDTSVDARVDFQDLDYGNSPLSVNPR